MAHPLKQVCDVGDASHLRWLSIPPSWSLIDMIAYSSYQEAVSIAVLV
jgi:hypothetical protein